MTDQHVHERLDASGSCVDCGVRVLSSFAGFPLPAPARLPHCTPSAFSGHSPLCDRDGRFCWKASSHPGVCEPHGV